MLHNDIPSHGEIAALAEVEGPTCITIVTPTEDAPQDYDKARIAFKDQVRSALASVEDPAEAQAVRGRIRRARRRRRFLALQSRSLVTYATPDRLVTFRLPNRLQALETVSDRFHLKPLLRSVTFPQTAFVLALAEGSVRLIEIAADQPGRRGPCSGNAEERCGSRGQVVDQQPYRSGSVVGVGQPKVARQSVRPRSRSRGPRCARRP